MILLILFTSTETNVIIFIQWNFLSIAILINRAKFSLAKQLIFLMGM